MTDSELVWSESGNTVDRVNKILRLAKTPGATATPVIDELRYVGAAEVFGADVYFTESGDVKKVPLAGGAASVVAGYPASALPGAHVLRARARARIASVRPCYPGTVVTRS